LLRQNLQYLSSQVFQNFKKTTSKTRWFLTLENRRRSCAGGRLDGEPARCAPLSQEFDYALDRPPTVLFRHERGPIAQTNSGELLVYPGTILHMECLFLKRFGTPAWTARQGARAGLGQEARIFHKISSILCTRINSKILYENY
jgi:hypothetical protein